MVLRRIFRVLSWSRCEERRFSRCVSFYRQGTALVLVLASLVFLTVLVVAFLMSMRAKVLIAKAGADGSSVRLLGETSVALVISQVRDATLSATNGVAWVSQPGMIRLYKNNGQPEGYRKLYSWSAMNGSGAFYPFAEGEQVPGDWADQSAIYTDLNAPARGIYPILDYQGAVDLGVKSFSLEGTVPGATFDHPAPMPVQWLYVLADGTLHAVDAGSSGSRAVISSASKSNPIVGRIAFWADDETAKVNINTASTGTFWATPRFEGTYEHWLANFQPARGEYQRYPGHAAGVSLKTVFPSLTDDEIYALAPRISQGGSLNGNKGVQDTVTPITTDRDRLYASVDELIFANPSNVSSRSKNSALTKEEVDAARFFLTAASRAPELNLFGQPRIATWPLHEINDTNYRTANDRLLAFCATIGGQPFYFTRQESVLPQHDIDLARNRMLLDYLDVLTGKSLPGFGGNFVAKYSQPEMRQILTEIFDYIRCTNVFDETTTATAEGDHPYAFALNTQEPHKGRRTYGTGASLGSVVPAWHSGWDTMGFGGKFMQIMEAHLHFIGVGRGEDTSQTPAEPAIPIWPDQIGTRVDMDTGADPSGNTPKPNETAVQAYLTFSFLNPSEGVQTWTPGMWIEVEGLENFGVKKDPAAADYTPLQFPSTGKVFLAGNMLGGGGIAGARVVFLSPYGLFARENNRAKTFQLDYPDQRFVYPLYSAMIPVATDAPLMPFRGGTLTVKIYATKTWSNQSADYQIPGALIQTLLITFPDADFPTPLCNPDGMRHFGSADQDDAIMYLGDAEHSIDVSKDDRWRVHNGWMGNWMIDSTHDVFKSVGLVDGDIRLLLKRISGTDRFRPLDGYADKMVRVVHSLTGKDSSDFDGVAMNGKRGKLIANVDYTPPPAYSWKQEPYIPAHINGVYTSEGVVGDWDNATSLMGDGPFINAADPGSVDDFESWFDYSPYFRNTGLTSSAKPTFFSPNRQLPSPVMFGSLSTGVKRGLPWQTLLFRPGPSNHPGSFAPKDYLLLDWFWMPMVEPYAISEPFSTAGKINLNQQIVPFTYIHRMTGLEAVMSEERIAMMPKANAKIYKTSESLNQERLPINMSQANGALRQFNAKFSSGELFRSLAEICDIYLPPEGKSWSSDAAAKLVWYGNDFALVGDNTRERPYADIYNRITTKSNVFTVFYQVQVLRQTPGHLDTQPTVFDPSQGDQIRAEQRGSVTFERYLDPNDVRFTQSPASSFLSQPASHTDFSFEPYYRTRILHSKIFNP